MLWAVHKLAYPLVVIITSQHESHYQLLNSYVKVKLLRKTCNALGIPLLANPLGPVRNCAPFSYEKIIPLLVYSIALTYKMSFGNIHLYVNNSVHMVLQYTIMGEF